MEHLTIGGPARRTGMRATTRRYRERRGLLPPPAQSPSGYRLYPADAVERAAAVKRARVLGFPLRESGELLSLRRAAVDARARAELREIEEKLGFLREVKRFPRGARLRVWRRGSAGSPPHPGGSRTRGPEGGEEADGEDIRRGVSRM